MDSEYILEVKSAGPPDGFDVDSEEKRESKILLGILTEQKL